MRSTRARAVGFVIALALVAVSCGSSGPEPRAETTTVPTVDEPVGYLFSYFKGEGEDGLFLAYSDDGLAFDELNGGVPVLAPPEGIGAQLLRDPSIVLTPAGTFHAVWTTGWWQHGFAHATSKDLATWSEPTDVAAMAHVPSTLNVWAPEIHWDDQSEDLVVVFASTVRAEHPDGSSEPGPDGAGLEHRHYSVTSRDGEEWSRAERFYPEDRNVIDAQVVEDGGELVLVLKDETLEPEPAKTLHLATSQTWAGPWSALGPAIDAIGPWAEGPSLLRSADDTEWRLYADRYVDESYALATSPDLETWTNRSKELTMPDGARHGTVLVVPRSIVEPLRSEPAPG